VQTIDTLDPIKRIWRHISWILSGRGYAAILSLIYLAILTRTLGPANYGIFAMILATALTVQLLVSFNVWQILVKYGHEHIANKDHDGLARLIRFCTMIDVVSALFNIIVVCSLFWLGQHYFGLSPQLLPYCIAYAIIFLLSIRNVPRGILRLHNHFKSGFLADGVVPTFRVIGVLAIPSVMPALPWFLLVWALSEMAGTILFWVYATRLMRERYGRPSAQNWRLAGTENKGMSTLLWASNIGESAYAAGQQLPILLVGAFVGVAEAGLFRLAAQLSLSLSQLAGLINLASFTEMTNVYTKGGLAALKTVFVRTLIPSVFLAIGVVVTAFLLGKPLIQILSGSAFLGAFSFLVILVGAAGMQMIASSCEPALLAAGRAKAMIWVRLFGAVFLLLNLVIWLPHFGAISAAWIKLTADALGLIIMAGLCWNLFREI
jgi:O-antigen/teichoic acid export membrane protein